MYLFAINSFKKSSTIKNNDFTLLNLKQRLIDKEYSNNITIKCIDDSFDCLVFIDNVLQKDRIEGLFKNKPTVYKYNSNLDKIDFVDLELEQLQRYEIVFEYSCNAKSKCSELIVQTDKTSYIFNDTKNKPIIIEDISDVEEYFNNRISEVKDAF